MNAAIRLDDRCKFQTHAKFTELNRDRAQSGRVRLDDWERKFSAGEEACFFAIERDQIGLGKDLQETLLMQGLDHRAGGGDARAGRGRHRDRDGTTTPPARSTP